MIKGTIFMARKRRPLKETVFFESLFLKIIYFPFVLMNKTIHLFDFTRLRIWRIKNVDIPYKKRK
jgi:hypothetical protein